MNENNQNPKQNEEEISLIDLFAVLLRYRKLIIGTTICAVIIAAAGYIIYPAYQYRNISEDDVTLQGRMLISVEPNVRGYIAQRMETFFYRPEIILDSLREAGMDIYKFKDGEISLTDPAEIQQALYIIDRDFVRKNKNSTSTSDNESEKNIYRVFAFTPTGSTELRDRDNNTFEIIFRDKDPQFILDFFHSLYSMANKNMAEIIKPIAELRVNNLPQVLEMQLNSRNINTGIFVENNYWIYNEYIFMRDFLDGTQNVLIMHGDPIIMEQPVTIRNFRRNFRITAVIIVFAGFFLSVFAAFALNVIRSIKNDEQAMKKIREAMGKQES